LNNRLRCALTRTQSLSIYLTANPMHYNHEHWASLPHQPLSLSPRRRHGGGVAALSPSPTLRSNRMRRDGQGWRPSRHPKGLALTAPSSLLPTHPRYPVPPRANPVANGQHATFFLGLPGAILLAKIGSFVLAIDTSPQKNTAPQGPVESPGGIYAPRDFRSPFPKTKKSPLGSRPQGAFGRSRRCHSILHRISIDKDTSHRRPDIVGTTFVVLDTVSDPVIAST